MSGTEISISRFASPVRTLGPGVRAVVWVRGCPLRCPGCIAVEDLDFDGGFRTTVGALATQISALPAEVTGVTFSGGEPMAQAGALAELVDVIRAGRDWSVMSYSGFTLDHLTRHGDAGQRALLDRLDILVDGPYVRARHADLAWRGSDNQQVRLLTERHTAPDPDTSAGIEFHVEADSVTFVGVPPVPEFRQSFEDAVRGEGVILSAE